MHQHVKQMKQSERRKEGDGVGENRAKKIEN
jgi:hypothetical protein